MLSHYLKIALRSLAKHKGYASINLIGLALGLAVGMLVLLYVIDESSFDQFHTKADRIYRVGTDMVDIKSGSLNGAIEGNGWPIGKLLLRDFPEVEKVVYIRNGSNLQVNHDGRRFDERIFYAGPEFFELFDFELVMGNGSTALSKPFQVVLTESLAKKYFGNDDALGKTLTLADTLLFEVSAVMKDVPSQSHMQFGMLLSFATHESLNRWFSYDGGWGNLNVRNYVLLRTGADPGTLFEKARNLYMTYVKEDMEKWGMYMYVGFEPLKDVYLKTKRGNGMGPVGSIDRVYIVAGIAAFVILLACINFINLATARSTYRSKEVGLRKVVGSTRQVVIRQFLGESFLITLLSFMIALALIGIALPMFNQLLDKNYTLGMFANQWVVVGTFGLIALITFLSGYYPAILMSSLRPAEVLKGAFQSSRRGIQLRRFLVVFQFTISAALIICTFVVMSQLDYMQNCDLGFSGNQIVVVDADQVTHRGGEGVAKEGGNVFKNELLALSSIESVTFTNALPGRPGWVGQWAHAEERSSEESIGMEYMSIDEDYLKTLGLGLVAGHNFDPAMVAELEEGLIINETAVTQLGWGTPENAIGKKIDSPSKHPAGTVIGVVKDYHQFGLQEKIYPMAMDYNPQYSRYYAIRFKTTGTADLIADLESLWKKYNDGYDFKYFFLDENFARQYQSEHRLANIFTLFSGVTILIAVIGLLGLVSFMVVSKTKEIGIRKVLGADVSSITGWLSKEFVLLVVIACVVACPLAWYFSDQWLQEFAYRTSVNPMIFLFTLVVALGVTVMAVSFQTIRAAMADPVKSLRYE